MQQDLSAAIFHRGKKLKSDELLEPLAHCPICLSTQTRTKEFYIQRDPDVILLKCNNCKGCSTSRMPTDKALGDYYGSYYKPQDLKITFHNVERFGSHIYEMINKEFSSKKVLRILDFGGGDGSLGISLSKMLSLGRESIEVVLVDYNKEDPFEDGIVRFNSYQHVHEVIGAFDIILASAVLEHIPSLHKVLQQLFSILRSGGSFYARTPYMVPFKRLIKRLDFTFPAHVHDLGPDFWNRLPQLVPLTCELQISRAAIVETQWKEAILRTLIAYLLKLPSRVEELFSGKVLLRPFWRYVGGWEVLLKKL